MSEAAFFSFFTSFALSALTSLLKKKKHQPPALPPSALVLSPEWRPPKVSRRTLLFPRDSYWREAAAFTWTRQEEAIIIEDHGTSSPPLIPRLLAVCPVLWRWLFSSVACERSLLLSQRSSETASGAGAQQQQGEREEEKRLL